MHEMSLIYVYIYLFAYYVLLYLQVNMIAGWNLEDLLGTEKMFRKAPVKSDRVLELFQHLMTATHQPFGSATCELHSKRP